ncbi:MAG: homocysteine S-methyltransferase family protein, partial [Gammaproteobacteria bacterium]
MSKYRRHLPQLDDQLFLTDGGLETTLVFHDGIDLPYFAAFDLLRNEAGSATLRRYYDRYVAIAHAWDVGVVLEAPTWRANPDWGARLGYDADTLTDVNRRAIGLMLEIRAAAEDPTAPMVISGNLGPRGDGYRVEARMTAAEARSYHARQIETFAQTDADLVSAFTINYVEEAIGIVQAARAAAMPVAISFTVETDGYLPSGEGLGEAIDRTDAETGGYAAYYMINCAHPTHFLHVLDASGNWRERIRGLRAN